MDNIYLLYFILINIISFISYMIDKILAIYNKYRISERKLLIISIIGGAFGGLLSMYIFHHKTHKWYFVLINILFSIFYFIIISCFIL